MWIEILKSDDNSGALTLKADRDVPSKVEKWTLLDTDFWQNLDQLTWILDPVRGKIEKFWPNCLIDSFIYSVKN